MRRLLLIAGLLSSCLVCDDDTQAFSIADGTYVEREGDKELVDAEVVINDETVTVEYTGDDGERYVATYAIVDGGGG